METGFGVSVMAIRSDELRFNNSRVKGLDRGSGAVGQQLALELKKYVAPDNIACFLFADGLAFNFDPFVEAFEKDLSPGKWLPLFGGLAADNWSLQKTYQYHNDEVFSDGISSVVLSGNGEVAWGVNHGCIPLGRELAITRCKGNIIYEIDGIPALEVLKDYFEEDWEADWNKTSLNLCLGFRTPDRMRNDYGDYIVRYMMKKNDEEASVCIQSDVREGESVWIVRRDKELIINGLQATSSRLRRDMGTKRPRFVLHFDCVGRGKVVFREQEKTELIKSLQRDIGEDIPWMGFYTYGEIGPVNRHNVFHNFTAVVTAVY